MVRSALNRFVVVGTNFTKADTQTRSRFAITPACLPDVFASALAHQLTDFFVLSTCNRTEFYGCASRETMEAIAREQLNISTEELAKYFYFHEGHHAIRHLFRVAAGLDSQIIGDYEIVGQLKQSVKLARENNLIGTRTDRITSLAFQTSKEIKTATNLSSGKYSVSNSAAELISRKFESTDGLRILIVGLGKIGGALSRNLHDYFPTAALTLCNRTLENSERLAKELNASVLPFEEFTRHLASFDVVITAAQANYFLICPEHWTPGATHPLLIDLSIPQVIDPALKSVTELYTVDDVSLYHNALLQHRLEEVPKAMQIIDERILDLVQWHNVYFRRDVLHTYRGHMERILGAGEIPAKKIDKSFSRLIQQIRLDGYRGCTVIQTVSELMEAES